MSVDNASRDGIIVGAAGGHAVSSSPTPKDDERIEADHDSSVLTPLVVRRARLSRSDRVGLVVAALMLAAMFVVPLSLVRTHTAEGRDALNDRFAARAELGASFVGAFVADLADRTSARAARDLVGTSDSTDAFEQTVDAFSFDAALELDNDGRVVHVWPHSESLIGSIVSPDYVHLATALTGHVGVSNVVQSAARAVPIVAVAVPFDTPQGRHVFSGAFAATDSQLANYFDAAAPIGGGHAYLVDASSNIIVASTPTTDESDLTAEQLADIDDGLTTTTVNGTDSTAFRVPIDGTPWDVIMTTSSAVLYDPVEAPIWKKGVWLALLTVACVGGFTLLVRLARARATSVAWATAHVRATERTRDAALHVAAVQRDFTAAASHELRTPTTSIIGYIEEVLANDNQSEEDSEFLLIVQRNAHRLSRLIDDLLIIGQADVTEPLTRQEPTDICHLVSDVISTTTSAAHSQHVDVTLRCAADLPLVLVDPLRIEQALTNLVSNAVKFTPPRGNVTITIDVQADNPALVQVSIADTGIGIAAGELDRIFERFYRSRTAIDHAVKGTGLGLPIAKAMIEAVGGQITVASTIGEGTTFTVTLPTCAAA